MKRILITGGTGFIGSHLANQLYSDTNEIIVVGTKVEQSPKCHKFINIGFNSLDYNRMYKIGKIDICFHQAADNDTLETDKEEMFYSNFEQSKHLFHLVCTFGCRQFIYASSCAVYGNLPSPYTEDLTPAPLNAYGESKAAFDEWILDKNNKTNCNVVGLRYSNVYGMGESHKGRRASMIYQMIEKIKKGESPKLFKDGEQKRDWIYIKDVVKANLQALGFKGVGIFNCGSGRSTSFNDLVKIINNKLNTNIQPEWIDCPFPERYQSNTKTNMNKAARELNFAPSYDCDAGIEDMITEMKKAGI